MFAGWCVNTTLSFIKTARLSSKWLYHFHLSVYEEFLLFCVLPAFGRSFVCVWDKTHKVYHFHPNYTSVLRMFTLLWKSPLNNFYYSFLQLVTTILLSVSVNLTTLDISKRKHIIFVFLWLACSLSIMSSRFILVGVRIPSVLRLSNNPHIMPTSPVHLTFYLSIHICVVSVSWLLLMHVSVP